MTDHKFTDEELQKCIECCIKAETWGDCEDMGCPATTKQGCRFYLRTDEDYDGVIQTEMLKDSLDLIKRQKAEISKARQRGYESGKREVVREIYIALYNEIIDARNSNYEAIKERETKHNVNRYEDTFCLYCDGKIHALDGIFHFITELTKKYMEGE